MSQNKFVSLPALQLNHSKILLFLITGLHLTALSSVIVFIYSHSIINIILALLIGLSFYYYILDFKKLATLKIIKYRSDGMWLLGYESQEGQLKPLLVSIEPEYLATEWLIILRFKINQTKTKTIPVFMDMLSPDDFKQLRVVLPYILKMKKPADTVVV